MEITLKDAKEGMVLVSDVVDRNGRVLLIAGNSLTEKHIKVFKSWGIASLRVQQSETASTKKVAPSGEDPGMAEAEEHLIELFRYTDRKHPVIRELFEIALERKMEQLS